MLNLVAVASRPEAQFVRGPVLPCVIGVLVGLVLVLLSALILPRLLELLTPGWRQAKEEGRSHGANIKYYSAIVAAAIVAAGLVIAAAVLGAILAVLQG